MQSSRFFYQPAPTKTNRVIIRRAKQQDVAAIAIILKYTYQHTYRDPETKEMIFPESDLDEMCKKIQADYPSLLDDKNTYLLVAELDGKVIGFSKMSMESKYAFLDKLYILPDHQDTKIGVHLMRHCIEYAYKEHINCMRLHVWDQNTKAIKFYKNNLFEITGTCEKLTSDGKRSSGYELECKNVKAALENIHTYIASLTRTAVFKVC